MKHSLHRKVMIAGALAFYTTPARAQSIAALAPVQAPVTAADALLDLPLDELLTIETTSVARKRQRVSDSAAAVFVITQDDIRRSTATKISDLLRMVPGVEVAEQQTGVTAVSIRGFNSRVANAVLVMVDGRSIYVSAFSSVFWDQLMIPMADIERIEVVRGPGAALWGSNAVNGVINIVTKHSSQYLGTSGDLSVSGRRTEANLSHSLRIGDAASLRLYATVRRDDGLTDPTGKSLSQRWVGKLLGGRFDFEPNDHDAFTLQSDYSNGAFDAPFRSIQLDVLNPRVETIRTQSTFLTASALGRWTHRSSDALDWTLQAYVDHVERAEFGAAVKRDMGDVDLGLRWHASNTHDFNFGLNARSARDTVTSSQSYAFANPTQTDTWLSGYVQDDISLIANRLRLTLGTKLEENSITGFEVQPSARLFFRAQPKLALWAAVSRAVRTPSRFERNTQLLVSLDLPGTANNPSPLPLFGQMAGTADRTAERLVAFEAGVRVEAIAGWSVDIASYYNIYDRLTSLNVVGVDPLTQSGSPYPLALLARIAITGQGAAQTWGIEASLSRHITPNWKLDLTYSRFGYRLISDPATGLQPRLFGSLDTSPRQQAGVRSNLDLSDTISISGQLHYVDKLLGGTVPAYTEAGARLVLRPTPALELSLVGNNLLHAQHVEFAETAGLSSLASVARSVAVQARLRF